MPTWVWILRGFFAIGRRVVVDTATEVVRVLISCTYAPPFQTNAELKVESREERNDFPDGVEGAIDYRFVYLGLT